MAVAHLPGEDLVTTGLRDLASGTVSAESLLVSLAAPRLTALGVRVPHPLTDAEECLYRMLGRNTAMERTRVTTHSFGAW